MILLLFFLMFFLGCFEQAASKTQHGFSVLGTLKYGHKFPHFDYVDPNAPKGGHLRLWYHGNFDSLNPFILKGRWAAGSNPFGVDGRLLTFETLMTASGDEEDSFYGLIASGVVIPDNRASIAFFIRQEARWHDGTEITAEDVAVSLKTRKEHGSPMFRDVS